MKFFVHLSEAEKAKLMDLQAMRLTALFPDLWIIEEELRREEQKKRDKRIPIPISLPPVETPNPASPKEPQKNGEDERNVIVIDL